nr:MAG TPA: hypothetical protein [Caudoviricetes sp.]
MITHSRVDVNIFLCFLQIFYYQQGGKTAVNFFVTLQTVYLNSSLTNYRKISFELLSLG